jgi:V/A-type H+-transporting ATPase subunit A
MLEAFLAFHGRARNAVGAGVPLRAVLDTGAGARLLRLAETPEAALPAETAAITSWMTDAIAHLEVE